MPPRTHAGLAPTAPASLAADAVSSPRMPRARRFGMLLALLACPLALLAGCGGSSGSQSTPPANLQGQWGGGTAAGPLSLVLTATGGTLTGGCGDIARLSQPLVPDSQGNFDVVVVPVYTIAAPVSPPPTSHLTGTVSGRTMSVTGAIIGSEGAADTLTFGQSAPRFTGDCPG